MKLVFALAGVCVTCAACSSGGGDNTVSISTISFRALSSAEAEARAPGSRHVIAETGVNDERQLFEDSARNDVPGFRSFYRDVAGEETILFEARGDSGLARVYGANVPGVENRAYLGIAWSNEGGSTPVSGTADYAGFYAGVLTTTTFERRAVGYVSGEVRIDVDFDAMQADGQITNRKRYVTATGDAAASDLRDVTLGRIDIVDGVFAATGETAGGGLDQPDAVPLNASGALDGRWRMTLAGDSAAEVVGDVAIDHDYAGGNTGTIANYDENGVFLAER